MKGKRYTTLLGVGYRRLWRGGQRGALKLTLAHKNLPALSSISTA